MEKKYLYKSVPLPKGVGERLEAERVVLERELGFKVSLSDAIASMIKDREEKRAATPQKES